MSHPLVFGGDDRVAERNNTVFPWSAHVAFRVINDVGQGGRCTGALIGKDTILTAAHCLYKADRVGHEVHELWKYWPGADSRDVEMNDENPYPYGEWNASNCAEEHYPPEFTEDPDDSLEWDYAVIDLSACPDYTVFYHPETGEQLYAYRSHFQTMPVHKNLISNSQFGTLARLAGYTTDTPPCSGNYWLTLCRYVGSGPGGTEHVFRNDPSAPYLVMHLLDTSVGQSGAPILINVGGMGVGAIHIGGFSFNTARYVDNAVYNFIAAHSVDL